jgi:hypothetical protein
MQMILKIAVFVPVLFLMFIVNVPLDLPSLQVQLLPDAHAQYGIRNRTRRRTRRRTAVVVGSSVHAADSAQIAQSQQQAAAAEQEAAAAKQQAAAAAPPPPAAATGAPLPLGTVVAALPAGCVATPVGGVEYYYCGGNFYRAAFQGNQLVYVTTKP